MLNLTKEKSKNGIECHFFDLGGGVGLKLFEEQEEAEHARDKQRKAYKYGLGPEVLRNDVIQVSHRRHYDDVDYIGWAYFTEVVETFPYSGWPCTSEINNLRDELCRAFGIDHWRDLHEKNVGRNKDGKLICIDFGEFSGGKIS